MKKTLIVGALLAGATGLYAQGTVQFTDFASTFQIHIYAPQTDNPGLQITGNASNDKPAGTTASYNGGVVGGANTGGGLGNGNNITVQVEAAGGGTSAAALSSLSPVTQYTTTVYTFAAGAGIFIKPTIAGDTGIPNTVLTTPLRLPWLLGSIMVAPSPPLLRLKPAALGVNPRPCFSLVSVAMFRLPVERRRRLLC
jgi:hypothetical protein